MSLAALLALATPLAAAGTPEPATEEVEAAASRAAEDRQPAAGLLVFVDPETGEITSEPSREQVAALNAALKRSLSRSAEGLEPFELSAGGRGVHLAGRFHTATVVRQEADGTLTLECVDHPEAVTEAPGVDHPEWEEK